jgi:hypothetical protein
MSNKLKVFLFLQSLLLIGPIWSQQNQNSSKGILDEYPLKPLKGNIIDGRYYSPNNVFSCKAFDFGQNCYNASDLLTKDAAMVNFYNLAGCFKKIEICVIPQLKDSTLNLKMAFQKFCMPAYKIEESDILHEQFLGTNGFLVVLSSKQIFTIAETDKSTGFIRGCLVFQRNEQFIIVSDQIASSNEKAISQSNIDKLKNDVMEIKNSIEFDFK